mgnify:CR=1 FL=1
MTTDDLDRLERERRDADTALQLCTDGARSCGHRDARDALSRDDFDRLATALILLLQQITAFVETKDRALAADARMGFTRIDAAHDAIAELRTQRRPRAARACARSTPRQRPGAAAAGIGAAGIRTPFQQTSSTSRFEDAVSRFGHRRSPNGCADYVPIFMRRERRRRHRLRTRRVSRRAARRRRPRARRRLERRDGRRSRARARSRRRARRRARVSSSAAATNRSAAPIATQVIEHLEPAYLLRLIDAASRALRPDAPIVLETINPACWLGVLQQLSSATSRTCARCIPRRSSICCAPAASSASYMQLQRAGSRSR